MTLRLRRPQRIRRDPLHAEDRFQFWITVGFVAIIALVIVILVAAVGLNYYNAHIRPVATVDGAPIDRDQWDDRTRLTLFRIARAESLVREQVSAGLITSETANTRLQQLSQAEQTAAQSSIEELIDLLFQGRLAAERGISATEEEIETAIDEEATIPERRRVQAVFVEPEVADVGSEPTQEEDDAAREMAESAAAELADGVPFAQVAGQYSTDISSETGGEYGVITAENSPEDPWVEAIFQLPLNGTTDIVKGTDGIYRIGRVTEIVAPQRQPFFLEQLQETLSLDKYRVAVGREVVAEELNEAVTDELTAAAGDQLHLAEVLIEQSPNEDEITGEGVIRASHILYSPNDEPSPEVPLPDDDPAWQAALDAAQGTTDRLRATADVEQRIIAFEAAAMAESDDPGSGAQGGDLDFFSRARPYVTELTDPLFDDPNLQRGDIVGPIKTAFGYHVVLFQERRAPTEQRITSVEDALAQPDADFAVIAREHSDGDAAAEGGDLGWMIVQELPEGAEDAILALEAGGVSERLSLADGTHFYKLLERASRPLEPDQQSLLRQNAFRDWYTEQKRQATADGRITRDQSILAPVPDIDQQPGLDQVP